MCLSEGQEKELRGMGGKPPMGGVWEWESGQRRFEHRAL